MSFEYINSQYGVNACVGRRVMAYGEPGTIVRDFGHYIGVVLDTAPYHSPERYHPTDGIEYGEVVEYSPPKLPPVSTRQKAITRIFWMLIAAMNSMSGLVSTSRCWTTTATETAGCIAWVTTGI
ncbi:hypothetical protein [Enterobacter hormaechei]|uniref:hypothetical protein n=1 Tax=Enterobacter cloacae complex TaxID=354276 RepID=UPI002FD18E65